MLLMALEQLQAFLQQRLQLGILCIGNERLAQGLVDCLVIRHFVVDIGLVERCAVEISKLLALGVSCLRQALAGSNPLGHQSIKPQLTSSWHHPN
jgi:hypothetical protein